MLLNRDIRLLEAVDSINIAHVVHICANVAKHQHIVGSITIHA